MSKRRVEAPEAPAPLVLLAIVALCLFGSSVAGGDRSEAMSGLPAEHDVRGELALRR